MTAALTGGELVAIIGAYTAFVLGAFGVLLKFAAEARGEARTAKSLAQDVNRAVNNRPPGEPTLYNLVAETKAAVDAHGADIAVIRYRLTQLEQKTPPKET